MAAPTHGSQVGITIDATAAFKKLASVGSLLTVRQLLEGIGQKELRWTGLNLQEAGKLADGKPWEEMKPLTLRRRPQRRSKYHFSSPYQTLLQQSMVMSVEETRAVVNIGTSARYAVEHHEGVPSRNLPARKLLPAPDVARRHALEFMRAVVAQVAAAGK